jgi:hypothetical protein
MSCNNCNKNNCSCGTTPLRYNGPAIECLGIDCNLTYDDALAILAEYMCDRALEKGDKGDKGDTGEAGADSLVPGPQGDPGTNGTNGTNGINGINGINGADGTNGVDGIPGIFTAIADVTIPGATTSFTNFVGSGVGSMTFPGNSLSVGDTFMLKVHVQTTMTFATDLNILVELGGVALATHTSSSGSAFVLQAEIVVRSIGLTGSIQYGGVLDNISSPLATTSVVDTTNVLGIPLEVSARFLVGDAGNSTTSKIVTLTKIF